MNNNGNDLPTTQQNQLVIDASDLGAVAVAAKEQAQIQAAVISAKKFPRNEIECYRRACKMFERPEMAECAQYSFPRGKQTITGPTVDLARALGKAWGNLEWGFDIVSADEEYIHIKGWAWDSETNARVTASDKFNRLIQKKIKQGDSSHTIWIKPDERELRELINKRAAILIRNCILQLMPPDLVQDVQRIAIETLKKQAAGQLGKTKAEVIKSLIAGFDQIGVSVRMLEKRVGHTLDLLSGDEIVELRGIYKSVRDGHSNRSEHFEFEKVESDGARAINAALSPKG